ncbi:hypothetical protein BGV71_14220 [Burkholderia ubonensis]|uniref:hypothetical protein n=1 Tax=Burkholderia ubonensis TaxID=101571 RepID=UPI0008FDDBE9|nr:hypothetical protein [Burkholderia ubonensis]OJA82922.1 hypothetical protein BGV71_14220 [Burkholderia ubonensis]
MANANASTIVADEKEQETTVGDVPADKGIAEGTFATAADGATTAPAIGNDAADSVAQAVEHPLDIISEIEHLLRIVGNVAVHECRRITERLADLKNHPTIKRVG